jgi:hypothetical protein
MMKARPGVTREDVVQACLRLMKKHRWPGPANVRLELGRGSKATIRRHLQWLALVDTQRKPARRG